MTCFGMFTFSCGDERPDLIGCWTHAYEEGQNLYKACDSQEFEVSWFRQVYDFKADGTVSYLVLHPADAHYMTDARWEFANNRTEIHIRDIQTNELIRKLRFSIIDKENMEFVELP